MEKKDPKIIKLEKEISSLTGDRLVELITSLREEKSFSGVIALMADLYSSTAEVAVRSEIEKFLFDLKDPELAVEVIAAIEQSTDEATRNTLLSSCWQSRIDYSDHLDFFIDYSISGSYMNALDCLTVIEQYISSAGNDVRKRGIKRISAAAANLDDEKQVLLREIISILES